MIDEKTMYGEEIKGATCYKLDVSTSLLCLKYWGLMQNCCKFLPYLVFYW